MFHRAELGLIIAGAHYISSVGIGLIMRFYGGTKRSKQEENNNLITKTGNNYGIFKNAILELITARRNDGRTLGELLGDSVREAINTLLMIGGFIILFSVVTKIIVVTGIIQLISGTLIYILQPIGLSEFAVKPLVSGFFEITNGTNLASQARVPLLEQLIIANIIIAWSGLSVHAQVATMINGTDINIKPYFFARIIQSILAGIATVFLFNTLGQQIETTLLPYTQEVLHFRNLLFIVLIFMAGILLLALIISLLIHFLKKVKIIFY